MSLALASLFRTIDAKQHAGAALRQKVDGVIIHHNIELVFIFDVLDVIVENSVASRKHPAGPIRHHLGTKLMTIATLSGDDESSAATASGRIANAGSRSAIVEEGGDAVGLGRCNESHGRGLGPTPAHVGQVPDVNPIVQVDGSPECTRDADKH